MQYCLVYGGTVFPLGLFCGIISIVLYCFLGYHLMLIARNTTTNETFKWSDYMRYVKYYRFKLKQKEAEDRVKAMKQELGEEEIDSKDNSKKSNKEKKEQATNGKDGDNNKTKRPPPPTLEEMMKDPPKFTVDSKGRPHVENIYQRGIFRNFYEVFFPPSLRTAESKSKAKTKKK